MSFRTDLEQLPEKYWSNDVVLFRPVKTEADMVYATMDCELERIWPESCRAGGSHSEISQPRKKIKLATEQCNLKAQSLYRSLGFAQLPELDGDNLVFGL